MNTLNEQVLNLLGTVKRQQETLEAFLKDFAETKQTRWKTFVVEKEPDVGLTSLSRQVNLSLYKRVKVCVQTSPNGLPDCQYYPALVHYTPLGRSIELARDVINSAVTIGTGNFDQTMSVMGYFDGPFQTVQIGLLSAAAGGALAQFTGKVFVMAEARI